METTINTMPSELIALIHHKMIEEEDDTTNKFIKNYTKFAKDNNIDLNNIYGDNDHLEDLQDYIEKYIDQMSEEDKEKTIVKYKVKNVISLFIKEHMSYYNYTHKELNEMVEDITNNEMVSVIFREAVNILSLDN
jgi:predicted ArsR family transcriptional regulator